MITKEIKNLSGLCFKLVDIEDKKIFILNDDYPLYKQALDELNDIINESIKLAENGNGFDEATTADFKIFTPEDREKVKKKNPQLPFPLGI